MKWYRWLMITAVLTAVVLVIGYGFIARPVLVETVPLMRGTLRVIVEDGKARLRQVEIGQRSGLAAQIVAGLTQEETVITHPSDDVQDGTQVQVQ